MVMYKQYIKISYKCSFSRENWNDGTWFSKDLGLACYYGYYGQIILCISKRNMRNKTENTITALDDRYIGHRAELFALGQLYLKY